MATEALGERAVEGAVPSGYGEGSILSARCFAAMATHIALKHKICHQQ